MAARRNKSRSRKRFLRGGKLETLEARIVMSADPLVGPSLGYSNHAIVEPPPLELHSEPVGPSLGGSMGFVEEEPAITQHDEAEFWYSSDTGYADDLDRRVQQTLAQAHDLTGHDEVMSKYGFTGEGQTVAILDSGIAYNHYALGGGFGSGYRVVGGYDFADGDANPYDDGGTSASAHGTHVAGIVGASDPGGTHEGVATGVDLVALKVFDSEGSGRFSYIANALDWIVENQNSFANPITAINLSLGSEMNREDPPSWAMLEEEFAAIEAAGIFISVSAGNSFSSYNEPGLAYPGNSDHVIPVMSTDNNGQLSWFSQRSQSAIAAPGRTITSTVPDYAGSDSDTIDDDWGSMSGTSMAAPYVAGASVLVREAMEFVGQTDIDQWDIFNHMMSTADTFYDSATDADYQRLNLEAAIDALMPVDDFGSSVATAHNLGTLSEGSVQSLSTMSGVISTLDDADYFTFTAASSGTVTFTADTVSHDLSAEWVGVGGNGWTNTGGQSYTMEVAAGQAYTVAIASSDGLGYYNLSIDVDAAFEYTDWGTLGAQQTQSGVGAGESWFRVVAGQTGLLTADLLSGSGSVALYNAQQSLLTEVVQPGGEGRFDAAVTQGEEYFVRLWGADSPSDIRLTNAISFSGSQVNVSGTTGADVFTFVTGANADSASLNGLTYEFAPGSGLTFNFVGGGGDDRVTVTAGAGAETAELRASSLSVTSSDGWTVTATGYGDATIDGGGGLDSVSFYDTAGDDRFEYRTTTAWQLSDGDRLTANGFENVTAYNNLQSGNDRAYLYGDTSSEQFTGRETLAELIGGGRHAEVNNYTRVDAYGGGGGDSASLYDSAGNDTFAGRPEYASMTGDGYRNVAHGFTRVDAYSENGGYDRAYLYDSAGDDTLFADPAYARLSGDGFDNYAWGFDRADAYTFAGGTDRATLRDSQDADTFVGKHHYSQMSGTGFNNLAWGFERADAHSSGGDRAFLYDSSGDDTFTGRPEYALFRGETFHNVVYGFDQVDAYTFGGGNDRAYLYDSTGTDFFTGRPEYSHVTGDGFRNVAWGFDRVDAYVFAGGGDTSYLFDSAGDDRFVGRPHYALMSGDGYVNVAWYAETVYAYASNGTDTAELHAGVESDRFNSNPTAEWVSGADFYHYAKGFDSVDTFAAPAATTLAAFASEARPSDSPTAADVSAAAPVATVASPVRVSPTTSSNATESASDREVLAPSTSAAPLAPLDDAFAATAETQALDLEDETAPSVQDPLDVAFAGLAVAV